MGILSSSGSRKRMTEEEIKALYQYFEEGKTTRQICSLTGRSDVAIIRRRNIWLEERKIENASKPEEPEVKPEEPKKDILNGDYAKSYLAGNAGQNNGALKIRKSLQINSRRTGCSYEVDHDTDFVRISLNDQHFEIPIKIFEGFTDELVDVFIECQTFLKK